MDVTEDLGLGVSTKSGVISGDESYPEQEVGVSLKEEGLLLLDGLTGVENVLPADGGGQEAGRERLGDKLPS